MTHNFLNSFVSSSNYVNAFLSFEAEYLTEESSENWCKDIYTAGR